MTLCEATLTIEYRWSRVTFTFQDFPFNGAQGQRSRAVVEAGFDSLTSA